MNESSPAKSKTKWLSYLVVILISAGVTVAIVALLMNIQERKREGEQRYLELVELDEDTVDPAVWGQNFPRQYDSYSRTVDTKRTRHGGSDAFNKLEEDPLLKQMFAGYAFSIDFREERGHAYMLKDQEETKRVTQRKQPGACLHCHSSIIPAYRKVGDGDVEKGFEMVCGMEWSEARKLVEHPVSCIDCHDPKTVQLRVTRPAFQRGIQALAKSDYPLPHFPSIERWRQGKRKTPYDVNKEASRQEMRTFSCAQCHVEYYFAKGSKVLTYPWANGLQVDQIEKYYDDLDFTDWKHEITGANMLKAQHPEFEMWNQGIHARSGVSCADCHMPYKREGAIKVSDHHVRSPLLNISRSCQVCHRYPESEILARAEKSQAKTKALITKAEEAVVDLIQDIAKAQKDGLGDAQLQAARKLHRASQWRVDFAHAENSLGFHAGQEYAIILANAIDLARQGQLKLRKQE